jgi:glutathionylspermidine synthase
MRTTPRADWEKKVEEAGLTWHTGEQVYWDESAFYEFTAKPRKRSTLWKPRPTNSKG